MCFGCDTGYFLHISLNTAVNKVRENGNVHPEAASNTMFKSHNLPSPVSECHPANFMYLGKKYTLKTAFKTF